MTGSLKLELINKKGRSNYFLSPALSSGAFAGAVVSVFFLSSAFLSLQPMLAVSRDAPNTVASSKASIFFTVDHPFVNLRNKAPECDSTPSDTQPAPENQLGICPALEREITWSRNDRLMQGPANTVHFTQ
jgi:hypothetical protein